MQNILFYYFHLFLKIQVFYSVSKPNPLSLSKLQIINIANWKASVYFEVCKYANCILQQCPQFTL